MVRLWAVAALSFGFQKSDGMVPLSSCEVRQQSYTPDWHSKWYLMSGNHEDGTCRNGDTSTGTDQQPCRWYGQQVAESVRASAGARYSCPVAVAGQPHGNGCVRNDTGGVFESEAVCVEHCAVCWTAHAGVASPSPCGHGGRCVPPRSWTDEAALRRAYDCVCAAGFVGELCAQRSAAAPAEGLFNTDGAKEAGLLVLALALLLAALAAVAQRRRRRQRRAADSVGGASLLDSAAAGPVLRPEPFSGLE